MAMTMAAGMAKKAEGEMVRAAFDVGSGATKMSVALVRVAANDKVSSDGGDGGGKDLGDATVEVKQILFEVREECLLRGDLEEQRAMGNGANLSQAALDHCFHILQRFKHSAAREHGATHFAGVATAVFREATNGKEFFSRVKTELGINVCIIPQTFEGKIGHLTAVAAASMTVERDTAVEEQNVLSLDVGGGSFQLTDANGQCFKGAHGSTTATAEMCGVQGRQFTNETSPNPCTMEQCSVLRERLRGNISTPAWVRKSILQNDAVVIALGGDTAAFRMAFMATGASNPYTLAQVVNAIQSLVGKSDEAIEGEGYPQARMLLPKLILVCAILEAAEVDAVHYVQTNGSCLGVIAEQSLWR